MDRRNFINLSSASVAGLLFGRIASPSAESPYRMNAPKQVMLLLDRDWIDLKFSGDSYRHQDVEVTIHEAAGVVSVYLTSPTLAVKGARLVWPYEIGAQARSLGDQWERTYGDAGWLAPDQIKKAPWYLLVHDGSTTACFGVKTNCNTFSSWSISPRELELTMDTHSGGTGVHLAQRKLHAGDIITTKNLSSENPFQTMQRFCRLMCDRPLLPEQPVYGINDWYYAYGNNSAKLILEQTRLMAEMVTDTTNKPFSVIDAGWATYSPLLPNDGGWQDDFSKPNEKFGDMYKVADQLVKTGMRPGLWMRPLCAKHTDPPNLLLPKIAGRNDPRNPVLDPTIEENVERIKHNIALYKKWGFELVKHDYSTYDITGRWGFQMPGDITEDGWRFNDNTRTTAEVIRHLYAAIRRAADDMLVIGCNTLSHLSAGLFELNRIGDDTSGREWDRTRKMGVNTLGFRIAQHKTFYFTDGDCVGLTNQVPWEKNKQWMQLLAESSTPLFISAQPDALGAEQRAFIKTCFAQAAKPQPVGEPLDWLEHQLPSKWKLNGREVSFNWD